MPVASLSERIDALLPQTQCGQCGYAGCRPYAEAIAAGTAEINQCPPGGDLGIQSLATLLARAPLPLNPANGTPETALQVAWIREAECIGCTKCIQACPVDAIVGANKWMHTVIAGECTGCKLCIPPCPVDCIDLVTVSQTEHLSAQSLHNQKLALAPQFRHRYYQRKERLARDAEERLTRLAAKTHRLD